MLGREPEPGETISSLDNIADGETLVVMTGDGTPVVLNREGDNVIAHSGVCPHGGCSVRLEVDNLLCPCHNSKFEFNGTFISGPANSDLHRTDVHVDGTDIVTGK